MEELLSAAGVAVREMESLLWDSLAQREDSIETGRGDLARSLVSGYFSRVFFYKEENKKEENLVLLLFYIEQYFDV